MLEGAPLAIAMVPNPRAPSSRASTSLASGAEMAHSGEALCIDGLATRIPRPAGWTNQR